MGRNLKNSSLKKKIKILEQLFIDFDFSTCLKLKNETEVLFAYMYIHTLLAALAHTASLFHERDQTKARGHSDYMINEATQLFQKLIKYVQIARKKTLIISSKEIRYLFSYVFILLSENGILEKSEISLKRKTYLFYNLTKKYRKTVLSSSILAFKPYSVSNEIGDDLSIFSNHYSTLVTVLKKNPESDSRLKLKDLEILSSLTRLWVYIDKERLQGTYTDIIAANFLEGTNLEEFYKVLVDEHLFFIRKKNIEAAILISQKISLLRSILSLKNLISRGCIFDRKIYLPFKMDFRGRIYFLSEISPTLHKHIRYCIHWGLYESIDKEYKNHTFNNIIENELEKYHPLIEPLYNRIERS